MMKKALNIMDQNEDIARQCWFCDQMLVLNSGWFVCKAPLVTAMESYNYPNPLYYTDIPIPR